MKTPTARVTDKVARNRWPLMTTLTRMNGKVTTLKKPCTKGTSIKTADADDAERHDDGEAEPRTDAGEGRQHLWGAVGDPARP